MVNFKRRTLFLLLMAMNILTIASNGMAHEIRPAYLSIKERGSFTYDVLWKVPARGGLRLGVYVEFPAGIERVSEPVGGIFEDAYVERYRISAPEGLAGQEIVFTGLAATKIDVLARIEQKNGVTQTFRALPDSPAIRIEADPDRLSVARTYLTLGAQHILLGIDHLLFVLALVLLVHGWSKLLWTITAFTLAHSITLALATLGYVHLPSPPVEACIALSIVFVASEILRSLNGDAGITERAPWLVAFTFGLLHGLGFAGALSEVGLPQSAIPLALLFFNIGVELGQLLFVVAVLSVFALLSLIPIRNIPLTSRVLPYVIGSIAMFWVLDRTAAFF